MAIPGQPRGIGGWLLFFVIGQFILVIYKTLTLPDAFKHLARSIWAEASRPPILRPMLLVETVLHLGLVILPVVGLRLIFVHSPKAPGFWYTLLLGVAGIAAIDFILGFVLQSEMRVSLDEAQGNNIRGIIGSMIWAAYWARSVRVRNTFMVLGASTGAGPVLPPTTPEPVISKEPPPLR